MSTTAILRLKFRLAQAFEVGGSRNPAMEGLRGFSALIVFGVHWDELFGGLLASSPALSSAARFLASLGHLGVDIFFVLSGYLIYAMAMKGGSYPLFLRRRVQRIYPVFLVVFAFSLLVALTVAPSPKVPKPFGAGALWVAANILLLPGVFKVVPLLTVAWSLSYEIFFYLTVPALALAIRRAKLARPARIAVLAACTIAIAPLSMAGVWHWPRMQMFGIGMILREMQPLASVKTPRRSLELLCAAAFAAYLALAGLRLAHVVPHLSLWAGWAGLPLFGLSAGTLCWFALFRNGLIARAFSVTPLRWLGNMSYSYYLVHGVALHGLKFAVTLAGIHALGAAGSAALMAVALVVTVLVSAAVFLTVEKPLSIPAPARAAAAVAS